MFSFLFYLVFGFILSCFRVYLLLEERVVFQVGVPLLVVIITPTVGLGCLFGGWFLGWCGLLFCGKRTCPCTNRLDGTVVCWDPLFLRLLVQNLELVGALWEHFMMCTVGDTSLGTVLGLYETIVILHWFLPFWQDRIKLVVPLHGRARGTLLEIHETGVGRAKYEGVGGGHCFVHYIFV